MDSREIVKRAIEFGRPPRLPFWQSLFPGIPDDVRDCWEMDRQKAGWFFDPEQWPDRYRSMDDWGCGWEASEVQNMGQVTLHPLADWSRLASYRPPNPRDPFYFQRLKGWHFILHSCGRVNDFMPYFIEAGVDVVNLQQPQTYGIRELGSRFAGKICFLTTADIQKTLPSGDLDRIRAEVRELVAEWSTAEGGFIVFNYGKGGDIGVSDAVTLEMFREFARQMNYWSPGS
jgi:hypothetical protein